MEEKNIEGYHVIEYIIASSSSKLPFLLAAPSGKFLDKCWQISGRGWEKTGPIAFMEIVGCIHSKLNSTARFALKCAYPESTFLSWFRYFGCCMMQFICF